LDENAIHHRIDAEKGIEPIGRIQHGNGYDAGWLSRTFVVGPTLYSVSDAGLDANALDTSGPIGFAPFEPRGDDEY